MPPSYRRGNNDHTGKCSPEMAQRIVDLLELDPGCANGLASRERTNNDPVAMIDRTCPVCGAHFRARNYPSRRARVYCSSECFRAR